MNDLSAAVFAPRTKTSRVSVTRQGEACGDAVYAASLSDDGQRVAATWKGYDLLENSPPPYEKAVLFHTQSGEMSLVRSDGEVGDDSLMPALSGDGRHVAYCTYSPQTSRPPSDIERFHGWNKPIREVGVFVLDSDSGSAELCSRGLGDAPPNARCVDPALSRDGQVVVFSSTASNLVQNDGNGCADIFAYHRPSHATTCISVNDQGQIANAESWNPHVSADGKVVAFASKATNLVADDHNQVQDIFVRDRQNQRTVRVSVTSDGREADGPSHSPAISANGRFVVFGSSAANLGARDNGAAVCVHDLQQHTTETLPLPPHMAGWDTQPTISADGRFVCFLSRPEDRAASPHNVWIYDRSSGNFACASRNGAGQSATTDCINPTISADGRVISFSSDAPNLVDLAVMRYHQQLYVSLNPLHEDNLLAAARQRGEPARVESHDTFVVINGVKVPKRALQSDLFPASPLLNS